jgi:hypothetical protein
MLHELLLFNLKLTWQLLWVSQQLLNLLLLRLLLPKPSCTAAARWV